MSPKTTQLAAEGNLDVSFDRSSDVLEALEGPKSRGSSVAKLRGLFTVGAATLGAAAAMGQTLIFDRGLNSDNKAIYDTGITGQRIGNFFVIDNINPLETKFSYTMTGGARRGDGSFTGGSDIFNINEFRLELFTRAVGGTFSNNNPDWSLSTLNVTGKESVSGTAVDSGPYHTLTFSGESQSLVDTLTQNTGREALVVLTARTSGGFNFVTFASNVSNPNPLLAWANDTSTGFSWTSFQDLNEIEQVTGEFTMSQPVPEPGAAIGLGVGIAAMLGRRRKDR